MYLDQHEFKGEKRQTVLGGKPPTLQNNGGGSLGVGGNAGDGKCGG